MDGIADVGSVVGRVAAGYQKTLAVFGKPRAEINALIADKAEMLAAAIDPLEAVALKDGRRRRARGDRDDLIEAGHAPADQHRRARQRAIGLLALVQLERADVAEGGAVRGCGARLPAAPGRGAADRACESGLYTATVDRHEVRQMGPPPCAATDS